MNLAVEQACEVEAMWSRIIDELVCRGCGYNGTKVPLCSV